MSHQFLVTADLSSAEDVDFLTQQIDDLPGVIVIEYLPFARLEPLTRAMLQLAVARDSENQDRMLNALTYALNVACSLVPGMHTP